MPRLLLAPLVAALLLTGCGDPSAPVEAGGRAPEEAPAILEVVCREDGSTELRDTEVRAQPDGVHIRVDNRADEFVSLDGAALDFSEGVTEQVTRAAPGELKLACWPGSKHTEPEPERQLVQVHDPGGHWVEAELECPRDEAIADSILDYASGGSGTMGDPEEIARSEMKGLEDDDQITTVGYPKAEPRHVAVERDDETIALLSYEAARQGGWFLGSYQTCGSAGISY
jgi:hypothetical protein